MTGHVLSAGRLHILILFAVDGEHRRRPSSGDLHFPAAELCAARSTGVAEALRHIAAIRERRRVVHGTRRAVQRVCIFRDFGRFFLGSALAAFRLSALCVAFNAFRFRGTIRFPHAVSRLNSILPVGFFADFRLTGILRTGISAV